MKYIKWIIGILAVIGVAVISVVTLNKFNTSKLFTSISEHFFLKDKGYKRKKDTVTNEDGDTIDIPEPLKDTPIKGAGSTPKEELKPTEEEVDENILHEVVDRKNVTPIENSFKKKIDKRK